MANIYVNNRTISREREMHLMIYKLITHFLELHKFREDFNYYFTFIFIIAS